MNLPRTTRFLPYATMLFGAACVVSVSASQIDVLLSADNRAGGNEGVVYGQALDDLGFLRKATVDMVGRIPTYADIQQFQQWPPAKRRSMLVDRLMDDKGYADRWTVFFADMLRIRSRAEGGNRLLAHVHKSLETGKPWDTMARELITASGSAGKTPSVGFLLADDSEPMTMAGATAQIFMGVRLACAQCHNHPFDKWRQKQFYELAGFFGKTKQVENRLSKKTYLTEGDDMKVLWPPERRKPKARFAVEPKFPIPLEEYGIKPDYIKRFEALRAGELGALKKHKESDVLEALIDSVGGQDALGSRVEPTNLAVAREAKDDIRKLDVQGDLYRRSALRKELGDLITSPKNRYFVRNIINRVWAEMVGRGFYMPIDDYQGEVTHPKTVKYLCDEFIANGYDFRSLFRTILKSEAYARAALGAEIEPEAREGSQAAFASGITRRMVSEVLYDSIVIAGHLEDYKWHKGANVRQFERRVRVPLEADPEEEAEIKTGTTAPSREMKMAAKSKPSPYNLEQVISLDFDELVKSDLEKDLGRMKTVSDQELEAKRIAETAKKKKSLRRRYTYKTVTEEIDDNPRFSSSMRMSTPAAPSHFLRVFGQPSRDGLGELREHTPSMRQALMMLNGKAIHEASRVGPLEPIHSLLTGKRKDLVKAVELAYLEILTRRPSALEQSEALAVLGQAPMQGMADLRWALLNSHEFRYLP